MSNCTCQCTMQVRIGTLPETPTIPKTPEKILFCGWRRDIDDMILVLFFCSEELLFKISNNLLLMTEGCFIYSLNYWITLQHVFKRAYNLVDSGDPHRSWMRFWPQVRSCGCFVKCPKQYGRKN